MTLISPSNRDTSGRSRCRASAPRPFREGERLAPVELPEPNGEFLERLAQLPVSRRTELGGPLLLDLLDLGAEDADHPATPLADAHHPAVRRLGVVPLEVAALLEPGQDVVHRLAAHRALAREIARPATVRTGEEEDPELRLGQLEPLPPQCGQH